MPVGPPVRILGIAGSLRRQSYSLAVLTRLTEATAEGVTITPFPLADVPLYNADLDVSPPPQGVAALRAAVVSADGLLLISPEYNCGMPGVLKNALDWASRPAFASSLKGKPTLIITVSPGAVGGVRAHAQLRETLGAASARPITGPQPIVPFVAAKMEDGRFSDPETLDRLAGPLADLLGEIRLMRLAGMGD